MAKRKAPNRRHSDTCTMPISVTIQDASLLWREASGRISMSRASRLRTPDQGGPKPT